MRVPAVLLLACLALAGAGYYLAAPREDARLAAIAARLDQYEPPPDSGAGPGSVLGSGNDRAADAYDLALVKRSLDSKHLTEEQTIALIGAAGRRYMRRKLAYADAQRAVEAGKDTPATLEPLQRDMDLARKVCDLAVSLGRRGRESTLMARGDGELAQRLAYDPATVVGLADRFDGTASFTDGDLKQLEKEFLSRFGKPLPVSALGDSAGHRALGFDHRGRVDVAVSPEQPEGVWVRNYLIAKGVPYFAFRRAVKGAATGAHIHIGPASTRRAHSD